MSPTNVPTNTDLEAAIESHRRELLGYCYRMLGAASEADDAVQETMIRAWRSIDRFERRSSLRTWLYRIATNVCHDMHRSPQRRARPMELGPSSRTADVVELPPTRPENTFIQPIADARIIDLEGDPAHVVGQRESIRLAFLSALQHLPPKQRSALILCEVLQWQASEVADLLGATVASVNSALQRARSVMASKKTDPLDAPFGDAHGALLAQYVDAFERYDMDKLVSLLRDDVIMSMPPFDLWLEGPSDVIGWFVGHGIVCQGGRLLPLEVNGTAGFGNYHYVSPGVWEPWAIQVIEVSDNKIVGHHNFLSPDRFADFALPARLVETI